MASNRPGELSRPQSAGGASLPSPTPSRADSSSSKASSPSDSIDFRFLNFAHPKDAKNAQTRRSVRSHVTSRQHQNQRRAAAEQAQRNQKSPTVAAASSAARSSSADSPTPSETEASSPEASSPTSSPSASVSPTLSTHSAVRINPRDVYPESWHPYLRPIMDHYLNSMSVDAPDTDATTREFIRTRFLALVLTDPAPLHALMLVAAAHYTKLYGAQAHNINILQLRGLAIQEINRALTDSRPGGRAMSDQLVAAISKMATYELLFGARDIFTTHMLGLMHIVTLRGGLAMLGLDGFLERALLWLDSNAALITSKPLIFQPSSFPSTRRHPHPDQRLFLLGIQTTSR